MAAQAQDARAEADRLESVSAEQRERTAAARTDVEDALRKADRIDPDVRSRERRRHEPRGVPRTTTRVRRRRCGPRCQMTTYVGTRSQCSDEWTPETTFDRGAMSATTTQPR